MKCLITVLVLCQVLLFGAGKKAPDGAKPDWAKKDISSYSDADLERLLDQWDEDEEPVPPDELPEGHPSKPTPFIDPSKLAGSSPEELMKLSKKGKTVMMFVRVNNPTDREETVSLASIWQTGLYNNHLQAEIFPIEDDRVMFMFRDGSAAWDAKDFLIEQERCEDVQLEQQTFLGHHCKVCQKEEDKMKADKEKKKKKSKKSKKTEL